MVHNDGPKRGEELYNGHRVIKIWEYDVENDQVIPGTDQVIVNGAWIYPKSLSGLRLPISIRKTDATI